MISIGANRNKIAYGIKHYNIDTEAELSTIDVSREVMGTTVFVIETSQRYMLNGSNEWKKIVSKGGSGSVGSGEEYDGGTVGGYDDEYDGGGVGGSDSGSGSEGDSNDDNTQDGGGV